MIDSISNSALLLVRCVAMDKLINLSKMKIINLSCED